MASKVALHKCFNPNCVVKTDNLYFCSKACANKTNAAGNKRLPIFVHRVNGTNKPRPGGMLNGMQVI